MQSLWMLTLSQQSLQSQWLLYDRISRISWGALSWLPRHSVGGIAGCLQLQLQHRKSLFCHSIRLLSAIGAATVNQFEMLSYVHSHGAFFALTLARLWSFPMPLGWCASSLPPGIFASENQFDSYQVTKSDPSFFRLELFHGTTLVELGNAIFHHFLPVRNRPGPCRKWKQPQLHQKYLPECSPAKGLERTPESQSSLVRCSINPSRLKLSWYFQSSNTVDPLIFRKLSDFVELWIGDPRKVWIRLQPLPPLPVQPNHSWSPGDQCQLSVVPLARSCIPQDATF